MLLALDEFAQGGVILGHNFKYDLLTLLHNYSKYVLGQPLLPELLDSSTDLKALWNSLTIEQFNDILKSMQIDGKPILANANIVDTEAFLKVLYLY